MIAGDVSYAKSGDVHIAYRVLGDGPVNVVYVPGFVTNVDLWEDSPAAAFIERLARVSRLVLFDKRGTGLSDPVPVSELPTLEERADDVRAVMDAAGIDRASMVGISEGGPMAIWFAAAHPDRVESLILASSSARFSASPDTPWGWTPEHLDRILSSIERTWGTGSVIMSITPQAEAKGFRSAAATFERRSASPGAVRAIVQMAAQIDVRHIAPLVSVPTLVMHASGDPVISVGAGRDLAQLIPGAEYVEADSDDHAFLWDDAELTRRCQEFLTGDHRDHEPDRLLATILFTDIVSSTSHQAQVGDRGWSELLDSYDRAADRQLARFRGRKVKHTGDGILATFDGPARAIRCAIALRDAARQLGLETRSGLHTGECEARGEDISGIAVNTAARVMAVADDGEVAVSRTVVDLVAGSGMAFRDLGDHELKGVPGQWQLFATGE